MRMTNEDAIKWLSNLKQDIGQSRHEDLWPYAQAIDEIIAMMEAQEAVTIKKTKDHVTGLYGGICPKCNNWIPSMHSYCGFCRQEVKWQ